MVSTSPDRIAKQIHEIHGIAELEETETGRLGIVAIAASGISPQRPPERGSSGFEPDAATWLPIWLKVPTRIGILTQGHNRL
jgi:hypothetical protein